MPACALSTYALSLYNLLQIARGRARLLDLLGAARKAAHPELDEIAAEAALVAMVERGLVRVDESTGEYVSCDPQLRICRQRSRSGDGWSGWAVEGLVGAVPLPVSS